MLLRTLEPHPHTGSLSAPRCAPIPAWSWAPLPVRATRWAVTRAAAVCRGTRDVQQYDTTASARAASMHHSRQRMPRQQQSSCEAACQNTKEAAHELRRVQARRRQGTASVHPHPSSVARRHPPGRWRQPPACPLQAAAALLVQARLHAPPHNKAGRAGTQQQCALLQDGGRSQ